MEKTISFMIIVLLLVILLGIWLWGDIEGWWTMNEELISLGNTNKPYELSQRGDRFSISGDEAGNFVEVMFDPFELKQGEEQTIILILKNPDEIESAVATVQDGNGFKILNFVRFFEDKEKNIAHYKINWNPQNLEPGISYQVNFEYLLKAGQKNQMGLFWHSAP
ncbi:MAG: hypothetical protein NTY11_03095 [Candidatus Parcubacteria bacterium]|nr:hypothetical protein [Candidatus Parcubacteria bacterium]